MTIGEKIQNMRKARGWSQEDLAEQVGVSRQAVPRWESNSAKPDADKIIAICDLFGVSADYLLRDLAYGNDRQAEPVQSEKNTMPRPWFSWGMAAFGTVTLFVLRVLASVNRTYIAPTIIQAAGGGYETVQSGYYSGFWYYVTDNGFQWLVWLACAALVLGAGKILWLRYRAWKSQTERG